MFSHRLAKYILYLSHSFVSPFTASSLPALYSLELEADNERDSKLCLFEPVLPKLLLASKLPVLFLATLGIGVLGVDLGPDVTLLVLTKVLEGMVLLVLITVFLCLVKELSTLTVRSSILCGDLGVFGAPLCLIPFVGLNDEGGFNLDSLRRGALTFLSLFGEAVMLD